MRLGRKASLFVAFYLLTSAGTAYTQIAERPTWVLWKAGSTWQNWEPSRTWDTSKECDDHLPRFRIEGVVLLLTDRVPGWCCLPDTVDPREAKGRDTATRVMMFYCWH